MKKLRIAHVVGKWLGGGVESVVMNYYRNIDRSKIQFDFFCDEDSTNIPYEEIKELGGNVVIIPSYSKVFKYQKKLRQELINGKYNIIHSHINTMSVFPLRAAKKAGLKIRIAHSHSTSNKIEWKKNLLKNILKPFSKIYATDYMCCSEYAGRWLFGNKEYDNGKVYLLNNAIDTKKYTFDENARKEIREKYNISDNQTVIGHIGRFVNQKNHEFLIELFNEYQKLNSSSVLILIGQGPNWENIHNLVDSLNIKEKVLFIPQQKDVSKIYNAFDYFVLPSLYEGLPVVGVEAQCNDLTCFFSTDMTKETKILEKSKFIELNKGPVFWAEEIFKNNEKIRKDVSSVLAAKNFDIKTEAVKLEHFYLSLI